MIIADARQIPLVDGCVQCVVTSPPYWGLRDYGIAHQIGLEASPDAYVAALVQVFREVWRVLKADGVLWLNLGDSYNQNWRGGGKETATAKQVSNFGTVDFMARKPNAVAGIKPKDLVGIPWRVAFALQADGWYLRSDIIWSKPNPMPESVTDRPTKAHEYVFLLTKAERYFWDAEAVKTRSERSGEICGTGPKSLSRGSARGANIAPSGNAVAGGFVVSPTHSNIRSVWSIATQPYAGAHFATMPEKLAERCILAGSRPGDWVLDPFGGSGTVVRVARRFNRRGVLLDLNPAYLDLADTRTSELQVSLLEAL